jgi:hypothetical protein
VIATKDDRQWVHALTLGGETSPAQRARNFTLYLCLKDGDPSDYRARGLDKFVYVVPAEQARVTGNDLTFMLRPTDECYARLLHVIADHFDTKCDADDEVIRLRARVAELERQLSERP